MSNTYDFPMFPVGIEEEIPEEPVEERAPAPILGKHATMALHFLQDHKERFNEAERSGTNIFRIDRQAFDEWCVQRGYLAKCPSDVDVATESPEYRGGLVGTRNVVRESINRAATLGKHGEWPPYDIQAKGEVYRVRLIDPLLEELHVEIGNKIRSIVMGKKALLSLITNQWATHPQVNEELRRDWRKNEGDFVTYVVDDVDHILTRYLNRIRADLIRTRNFVNNGRTGDERIEFSRRRRDVPVSGRLPDEAA